jgi:hypothetical protein
MQSISKILKKRSLACDGTINSRHAQRLAAQPLGRPRYLVTILARNPKPQSNVLSLSLGQVG